MIWLTAQRKKPRPVTKKAWWARCASRPGNHLSEIISVKLFKLGEPFFLMLRDGLSRFELVQAGIYP
jgi:hypothetical protein